MDFDAINFDGMEQNFQNQPNIIDQGMSQTHQTNFPLIPRNSLEKMSSELRSLSRSYQNEKDEGIENLKVDIGGCHSSHISREKNTVIEAMNGIVLPLKDMDLPQPRSCYKSKYVELGNDIPLRNQNFQARSCYPSKIMDLGQKLHLRNMDLPRDSYTVQKLRIRVKIQEKGDGITRLDFAQHLKTKIRTIIQH